METTLLVLSGSSPRVRGKPSTTAPVTIRPRIIPARAGQTATPARRPCSSTDHPRACGANIFSLGFASDSAGSSPRVRGKRQRRSIRRAGCPDHPRACGVNPRQRYFTTVQPGSSPRVRGKQRGEHAAVAVGRIIPARAGQTWPVPNRPRHGKDHPRACGANWRTCSGPAPLSGSSPRVRGKPGAHP